MTSRADSIDKAKSKHFDVCIIGGGITGAGILNNAVQRGWNAVLIDKNDFASGTSSRSSKMIHGGLRYLKMLQIGLVREALLNREHLLLHYPNLVKPLAFIMPSYRSSIDLALKAFVIRLYDSLAGSSFLQKSKKLSAHEVAQHIPGFNHVGLKGGVLYWDGWTNDAMLTIHTLKAATAHDSVVLNYSEAKKFTRDGEEITSLICTDKITKEEIAITATVYINATGVWADEILKLSNNQADVEMKPSKGVHIVVSNQKIASEYVTLVKSGTSDKRYLYSFPWENNLTVLGSTDTEYSGSADKLTISEGDVNYILNAFNKSFPSAKLTKNDIVSVYAGLRPMLDDKTEKGSYRRPREYRIWWSKPNLLNIAGGKLTSFLSMGERCIKMAEQKLSLQDTPKRNSPSHGFNSLAALYEILQEDASLSKPLSNQFNVSAADIVLYTRYLFAEKVEDVLTRRTTISYAMKEFDEAVVRETAQIMAKELGRDDNWINEQIEEYREHWKEYHPDFLNN